MYLTTIGLTPGSSSTVHTQYRERNIRNNRKIKHT
jgi:hypothetical protein